MEYLTLRDVRERAEECSQALTSLLGAKALVSKPGAKQWRFFRDCVGLLLGREVSSDFVTISPNRAAQLKFAVEDSLRRYYLRPGPFPAFVFSLVHHTSLPLYGIQDGVEYPALAGYSVLVRDLRPDESPAQPADRSELARYLERVVTECIDAEFAAYAALPELRLDDIRRWFCADSPAYREIANVLVRHREKGWTISNPLNPSTKRLLAVKIKKIDTDEATVGTVEYWYLRWWSEKEDHYPYAYRETNRQL